ncbi:ATP-dependent DNA helicase II subunit 2 [Cytospora mali]|uniref:ATP-dependent DNA helicase II subunit 2 n=1 Tax=Cytospora mali TaxID=578113 RepID=A0A194UV84_CYTMA|nr:ATP-dependent DNA helicase II subunit 2 [Valsa mali var. pyri (nom. inval.)]
MADKQAFVYIVDVGSSTANCNTGRSQSDLDWSLRYVWDKIAATAQASRKTWCLGVIGLRTDETNNKYQKDDGYDNISVLKPLGPIELSQVKELKNTIKSSNTDTGDAMSAIIVAAEMIDEFTKRNKYTRRIYLLTDGHGPIDGDDIDEISIRLNDLDIELIVLGVDFDDPDFGLKEEDKPRLKATNEAILKSLVNKCKKGDFATMAAAVEELDTPRVKPVKLVKNFDGPLTLGDPAQFPSAMSINIERWPVTKVNRPAAATTVVVKPEPGATQSTHTLVDDMEGVEYNDMQFNSVQQHRTYKVNDPSAPGGKKDVEFEDLAKGYLYGSTAVHIAESEWDITNLGTEKGFSILGFVHMDKVEPFISMGETFVTVARPWDEESKLALSALIHALYESETYAVARLVPKDNKDPVLLLMRPSIEPDFECLYDVPLPFAEDVRRYRFPPLDRVVTVTGKTLTKHRLLPDEKLNQAMSDYVDAMDLAEFGHDEEGNPQEYAALDDLYSPIIHRVNQAIRARAVDSKGEIQDIPILTKYSKPPQELVDKAKSQIEALSKIADVKPVPKKATGKGGARPAEKPSSGIDVDSLLSKGISRKKNKISKENAIPEFKQTLRHRLNAANEDEEIENAVKDMGQIVQSLIKESMGDKDYARAQENIGVMREQCIEFEVPHLYNDFLRDLKRHISSGALCGDRREMWTKYVQWPAQGRLGLITKSQCEASDVTEDEAQQFWYGKN